MVAASVGLPPRSEITIFDVRGRAEMTGSSAGSWWIMGEAPGKVLIAMGGHTSVKVAWFLKNCPTFAPIPAVACTWCSNDTNLACQFYFWHKIGHDNGMYICIGAT